jgi:hypothetical protein
MTENNRDVKSGNEKPVEIRFLLGFAPSSVNQLIWLTALSITAAFRLQITSF